MWSKNSDGGRGKDKIMSESLAPEVYSIPDKCVAEEIMYIKKLVCVFKTTLLLLATKLVKFIYSLE